MMRALVFALMLISTPALALPPNFNLPLPPDMPELSPDDQQVVIDAINALDAKLKALPNTEENQARLGEVRNALHDPRSLAYLKMALSWASKDPRACALLQRITPPPTPVCLK